MVLSMENILLRIFLMHKEVIKVGLFKISDISSQEQCSSGKYYYTTTLGNFLARISFFENDMTDRIFRG